MRYSGLIKSGKILAFGKNGAVGAVPYGMTGIMLPTGAFVSGETIMTAAMTTGYTVTGSNMLVKVNDSMAGLTGTNMMAGTMGQANYQLVKETSEQVSNNVLELGLSNPRLYGTNNNVGNIRENATIKSNEGEEKNKHIEIYDNEGAHRNLYGIKNIIVKQEKKM